MSLLRLLLGLCAVAFALSPANAQTRRAVVIGIDAYESAPAASANANSPFSARAVSNLPNAVADARAFAALLVSRFRFDPDDVVVLLDADATRDGILSALRSHLVDRSESGDTAVVYFVGHGSRIASRHPRARLGRDQTIVPFDARSGARDIWDKELAFILNDVLDRGAEVTAIFGSCYSGDIVRGSGPSSRAPASVPWITANAMDVYADLDAVLEDERGDPTRRGAIFLAASGEDQLAVAVSKSVEEGGARVDVRRGLFGWYLGQALRDAAIDEPSWMVFRRVKALMRAEPYRQDPRFEPSLERDDEIARRGRARPLFGAAPPGVDGRIVVGVIGAIGEVGASGEAGAINESGAADEAETILVDGGHALGLSHGCELIREGPRDEAGHRVVLERFVVERIVDLGQSIARRIGGSEPFDPAALAGQLLVVDAWGAPLEPLLRLHLPEPRPTGQNDQDLVAYAASLREALGERWLEDAVDIDPTHVLRRENGTWIFESGTESAMVHSALPPVEQITEALGSRLDARLVFELPVDAALIQALRETVESTLTFVDLTERSDADYVLIGRVHGGDVQVTWSRPVEARPSSGLARERSIPAMTRWSQSDDSDLRAALQQDVTSLARMRGWMVLESPPLERTFPYRLASHGLVLDPESGELVALHGAPLFFELAADAPPRFLRPRLVYMLAIEGASGEGHDVSNQVVDRTPVPSGGDRFVLRPAGVSDGVDEVLTFALLSSEIPLEDRSGLSWEAIRAEPRAPSNNRGTDERSGLEQLLAGVRGATRSGVRATAGRWSISRLQVRTTDRIPEPGSYELWCVRSPDRPERAVRTNRIVADRSGTLRVRAELVDTASDGVDRWRGGPHDDDAQPSVSVRVRGAGDAWSASSRAAADIALDVRAGDEVEIVCGDPFGASAPRKCFARVRLTLEYVSDEASTDR